MSAAQSVEAISRELIEEAADWMLRHGEGSLSPAEQSAFERWRTISAGHAAAWRRAQSVMQAFESLPEGMRRPVVTSLPGNTRSSARRKAVRQLAVLIALGPAAFLAWRAQPWNAWLADATTGVGRQRRMQLDDGTTLVLNTSSSVKISFSAQQRRVRLLAGEIMVTTGRDPAPVYRPFVVDTPHASIRALGTRFNVRLDGDVTHVAVLQDAVEVSANGMATIRLEAGQATTVGAEDKQPAVRAMDQDPSLWERGLLLARQQPLPDLLRELARYRPGLIRCHPTLAALKVTGTYSTRDTDASLALLARTLPIRITTATRWWTNVEPLPEK